jgi:pimeloyl-ACP methyl ester carboxylesterase/DNA-binding CsgD family transcriptional regulator
MSAPVRFVRSHDGTRIAYTVDGQGPPVLVLSPALMSHTRLYPELPGVAAYLAKIARSRTLIRVDLRGTGMADRAIEDHSPEAVTDDLDAVVGALKLSNVDIVANGIRAVAAVRLAVRRPDVVRKLILNAPTGLAPNPQQQGGSVSGLFELMRTNWDLYCEIYAQRISGKSLQEVEHLCRYVRRCIDQQDAVAEVLENKSDENWRLAATVRSPVLVIHHRSQLAPEDDTANLAQQIPGSRLIYLPESAGSPPWGEPGPYDQACEEFFGTPGEWGTRHQSVLTVREEDVLRLLTRGCTDAELAAELDITTATASRHVHNIYAKLGVHRRAEAVAWAIRRGFE